MTSPTLPAEPLLTKERLGLWAQERPLTDPDFADLVIDAVSTLVRGVGGAAATWDSATLPARARDIAYVVAKDYYLNPTLIRSESVGPISETKAEAVLQGIRFSDSQLAELESLAAAPAPGQVDGLWTLSFTRGPVEMGAGQRRGNIVLWDTRGGWPIEYLDPNDGGAFGLDD